MRKVTLLMSVAIAFVLLNAPLSFCQFGGVVSVTGSVLNEVDREPASVNVVVYDAAGKKMTSVRSNSTSGVYSVTGLKPGKSYKFSLEQPDFFQSEFMVEVPKSEKYSEVSRDFLVKPMSPGVKIPVQVSPFEFKKSKLRVGADEILTDIRRVLVLNPGVNFEIQSFPDVEGDKAENKKITEERAKALRDFFVSGGVATNRISVKGSDEIDPSNPPRPRKAAKGKRYIGKVYIVVTKA